MFTLNSCPMKIPESLDEFERRLTEIQNKFQGQNQNDDLIRDLLDQIEIQRRLLNLKKEIEEFKMKHDK